MLHSSYQHTIAAAVAVSGIGVHSGAPAALTIKPAAANAGIVFIRTDITDRNNIIPAKWDRVADTRLCTVLANDAGVTISTVEHVLSACAASGIDNAVIEVNGPEVPIMDGSAIHFLDAIRTTGLRRLAAPRRYLRIKDTVTYTEGDKKAVLSPAEDAFYSFEIIFSNPVIGQQKYAHVFSEKTYRRDIATTRSFGFLEDGLKLREMGLARGSSLENAVVIDGDKVMNPEGLRFPNEPVRHKILDAIGDIFLCGHQIIGHYHGHKAGHAMNNKVLHALFAQPEAF